MPDIFTPEKRSKVMAAVKAKNTKLEMRVRRELHARGLRYRLHANDLPGKPDLVFPRHKVALFVNGCFWHGHIGCKRSSLPQTNTDFWGSKIRRNIQRDSDSAKALRDRGWHPLILWECQVESRGFDWNDFANEVVRAHRSMLADAVSGH